MSQRIPPPARPFTLATRGSALALAQANMVLEQCRAAFAKTNFEIRIIKTTGDKLQAASLANPALPKGLFTKELEIALLEGQAELAVHSLKDLPTDLPPGLTLGAVSKRADVRDVLIYRGQESLRNAPTGSSKSGLSAGLRVAGLPPGATIATSSTRRSAQLLEQRPDLKIVPIRGNVPTRLKKLAEQPEIDALILAAAGLQRLGYIIQPNGSLLATATPRGLPGVKQNETHVPEGLLAVLLPLEHMLPCVGQAAIGMEIREGDKHAEPICAKLNDSDTLQCVTAERAFLKGMGGGCQLAVAAYAEIVGEEIFMRAVSFLSGTAKRTQGRGKRGEAAALGRKLADELRR